MRLTDRDDDGGDGVAPARTWRRRPSRRRSRPRRRSPAAPARPRPRRSAPRLRSASMAICLPGMASRVKRAATSATRSAPLVMTTNWMTTRIRKTTRPTTSSRRRRSGRTLWMTCAGVAVEEDQPGDADVERQAEQRRRPAAATGRPRSRAPGARTSPSAGRAPSAVMLTVIRRSRMKRGSGMTSMITTATTARGTASAWTVASRWAPVLLAVVAVLATPCLSTGSGRGYRPLPRVDP